MNLENLKKLFHESNGELKIKNYKVMCEILEVEPKIGGRNSKLHQEDFKRYFNFEKIGQSMIVKEIYEMEIDKVNNTGAKGKFTDDLQNIYLNVLSQCSKGELLFSKSMLLKQANMINKNYAIAKRNIPTLSELINVDEDVCYDFFNNTQNKLLGYVETALKRLRSRRLIVFEKVMVVAKIETVKNCLGEDALHIVDNEEDDSWEAKSNAYLQHRQATLEEKQYILKVEKEVLNEMKLKDSQQAFLQGKWHEYKDKVNKKIQQDIRVKFWYEGYLITYNFDDVIEELPLETTVKHSKSKVNSNVVETLTKNVATRNKTAIKNIKEIEENISLLDMYSEEEIKKLRENANNTKRKKVCRFEATPTTLTLSKDNIVESHSKIIDVVIKSNAKDVTSKLDKRKSTTTTTVENNN